MRSDLYKLVTLKDGKSDSAAIVSVFAALASGKLKSDLRLLNYYCEVPVTYGATILAVEEDSVVLKVHEHQAVVMKEDNATLLKCRHFERDLGVHCHASYVSIPKSTVILGNFAYAQIRAERREAVRVKVSGHLPAKYSADGLEVAGLVEDISGTGLSLKSAPVPALAPEQPGQVALALLGQSVVLPANFVRTIGNHNPYLHVFQITPNRVVDNLIGKYIYQRQVELIQELKDAL